MEKRTHWQRYLIKWWIDPYNEKGQYFQNECYNNDKESSINIAKLNGDRSMVIDLFVETNNNKRVIFYNEGHL